MYGLSVVVANEFDQPMALLETYVARSVPVILSVDTAHLPYWTEATDHAVVVALSGAQVEPCSEARPAATSCGSIFF